MSVTGQDHDDLFAQYMDAKLEADRLRADLAAVTKERDAYRRLAERGATALEAKSDAVFRREVAADIRVEIQHIVGAAGLLKTERG